MFKGAEAFKDNPEVWISVCGLAITDVTRLSFAFYAASESGEEVSGIASKLSKRRALVEDLLLNLLASKDSSTGECLPVIL